MIIIKKTGKILGTVGAGFLALKEFQAIKEKRSLRSLLVEESLDAMNLFPTIRSQEEMEQYIGKYYKPYKLPEEAKVRYRFKYLKGFDDTLEYVPKEQSNKVIFYIHGGSYWFQPVSFQYAMMNKISKMADARVVMPIYPKAPIHNAHEATAMVLSRYLYLINEELVDPDDIIMMGDSAGGGMVLSLLQLMRNRKYPLPEKAILISPWLDISTSNPEMEQLQSVDPILHIKDLQFEGKVYADGLSVKDPLVSPIYGDSTKLPPIHLFIGTHDIFYADAKKFNEIAFEDNVDLTMYTYPNMDHVFPAYPIPEAKEVLKKIASLVLG